MIFTSPHPDLSLPPTETTILPHFLLKTPFTSRTSAELFFPPPKGSPFTSSRPSAKPLSLEDVRILAYQTAKSILNGAIDGKSTPFQKGDVVAIYSSSQHDYTAIILGIHLVGGITALCNPSYKSKELAHQLRMTKSRCVITTAAAAQGAKEGDNPYEKAKEAIRLACSEEDEAAAGGFEKLKNEPTIFLFEEEHEKSWRQICEKVKVTKEVEKEVDEQSRQSRGSDAAVFCFSSGTSGLPKAVTLSHTNLISNIIQATFFLQDRMNEPLTDGKSYSKNGQVGWYDTAEKRGAGKEVMPWISIEEEADEGGEQSEGKKLASKAHSLLTSQLKRRLGSSDEIEKGFRRIESRPQGQQEFHVDVLPLFHCYGFLVALIALHTCTPRIVLPRFHLETYLKSVSEHGATFSFLVPPIIIALAKHPLVEQYDLSTLWRVANGAASLPDEIAMAVGKRLKIRCTDGYGMTEMTPIVSMQTVSDIVKAPNTVGSLAPNTKALILDSEGKELGPNEAGELLLHGPQMMKGYFENEKANKQAFYEQDGIKWLRTGDVCKIDERGYITITDRLKDVIKAKGFQVSPAELEAVVFKDSRVADVAVTSIQDSKDGAEKPWAFVVAHESVFGQGNERDSHGEVQKEKVAKSILEKTNSQMAGYKKIEGITWLDALPRSDAGKVLKRNLAAMR